jgi:GH15 family glucan-1,4-alpha-glucosidase
MPRTCGLSIVGSIDWSRLAQGSAARTLFERYVSLVGPTGLMSEECNPDTGGGLGNDPQAYAHAGLICAALRLAAAGAST